MNKEEYFTVTNIYQTAQKLMETIIESGLSHEQQVFDISGSGLLILDMQNYFLSPESHAFVPSAPAIISKINLLIKYFQENERPIIFTQHINEINKNNMMESWWRDVIKPNSYASEITDDLERSKGIIIKKDKYDAFLGTDLDVILKRNKTTNVVISGVMTHLCCETTARSAFMHNYRVFFPIDATATYIKKFHEATLLNLSHGFARPVYSNDLVGE